LEYGKNEAELNSQDKMLALQVLDEFAGSFAAEQSTGCSILACTLYSKNECSAPNNLD
jgi:hypothetical protein